MNKQKPVFIYFYIPNDRYSIELNVGVEEASKKFHDKVTFIKVNCKINKAFCKNTSQTWNPDDSYKLSPSAELLFPYEEESSIEEQLKNVNAPFMRKQLEEMKWKEEADGQKLWKFRSVDFGTKEWSYLGVHQFLIENEILESEVDPIKIMERVGEKYLWIM